MLQSGRACRAASAESAHLRSPVSPGPIGKITATLPKGAGRQGCAGNPPGKGAQVAQQEFGIGPCAVRRRPVHRIYPLHSACRQIAIWRVTASAACRSAAAMLERRSLSSAADMDAIPMAFVTEPSGSKTGAAMVVIPRANSPSSSA